MSNASLMAAMLLQWQRTMLRRELGLGSLTARMSKSFYLNVAIAFTQQL